MINRATLANHHYRRNAIDYVVEREFKTIIDVGGAMNPWLDTEGESFYGKRFITAFFDWNCQYLSGKTSPTTLMFHGNVSNYWEWDQLLRHVTTQGKFDFAICTQTLEDIRDPVTVLELLPKIAKEGYIDVPSKYLEMKRGCDGDMLNPKNQAPEWGINNPIYGWIGHRWIMNMIDDVVWLLPKLPLLEVLEGIEHLKTGLKDAGVDAPVMPDSNGFLCFFWEDDLPYKVVGEDFLGPNPVAVLNMYRDCLNKGL